MTATEAIVDLHDLGFVVTVDGRPWPKTASTLPPRLLAFASRTHAREFAAAVSADDHARAHDLIERHGRWWQAAAA